MARVKKKKAPEGYRWKTVTVPSTRPNSFTTKRVLVPIEGAEKEVVEAPVPALSMFDEPAPVTQAYGRHPGQAVDPNVDRTPLPETRDQVWAGINPNLADMVESIKEGEKDRAKFKDTWGASKPRMAAPGGATEQAYRELGSGNPFYAQDALAASTPFLDIAALTPVGKAVGLGTVAMGALTNAVRKKGIQSVVSRGAKTEGGRKVLSKA